VADGKLNDGTGHARVVNERWIKESDSPHQLTEDGPSPKAGMRVKERRRVG